MLILIGTFSFIAMTLLTYGLLAAGTAQRRRVQERYARFVTAPVPAPAVEEAAARPARGPGSHPTPALRLLEWSGRLFAGYSLAARLELELQRAGLPLRGAEFIALQILAAAAGGLLLAVLGGGALAGAAGAAAGAFLPRAWLSVRQRSRLHAFNAQIGDALTTMSNSLRAGYSFLQAMEMVGYEMAAPIGEEFGRALRDMSLGVSTEAALETMARRVGSDDLDLVVTAVIIQRQVGGNLAEVLENIAVTVRERIRIRDEIRTLTAQGRISGMVIAALPVGIGLFIAALNPEYVGLLFTHPLGQFLLVLGVLGEILGYLLIRRIVNIEV